MKVGLNNLICILGMSVLGFIIVNQCPAESVSNQELPIVSVSQGWGQLGINTAVVPPGGRKPRPITMSGKTFVHGLGTHAPSRIVLDVQGSFESFEAKTGIQDGNAGGTVVFQVVVDGKIGFDSGIMTEKDLPKSVKVSVRDAQQLELVVTDASDGINSDVANWADIRLIPASGSVSEIWSSGNAFDIAPFAKVYSWDPSKVSYHPNRVGELKVEEIFHGTEIMPASDGSFKVPASSEGQTSIGLQWYENRKLRGISIEFAQNSHIPTVSESCVEWWIGESAWQGDWIKLTGQIEVSENRWFIPVNFKDIKTASDKASKYGALADPVKIRWVFPRSVLPIVLGSIKAYTRSQWNTVKLSVQSESGNGTGKITLYNGQILSSASDTTALEQSWNLSRPLTMELKYCVTRSLPRSDRTILQVQLPAGNFGVAVEDVIENGGVYVPDYGFYVTLADKPLSLQDYKEKKIEGRKTVLEKVRQMPDQSFERAMDKVHRQIQDQGPVMLSLACDNVKYIVERHGKIWYSDVIGGRKQKENGTFHIWPSYGFTKDITFSRHLYGDWLPVPVHTFKENGVVYEHRAFVAPASNQRTATLKWLNSQPLFVSEFTIENTTSGQAPAKLYLSFRLTEKDSADVNTVAGGFTAGSKEKCIAFTSTSSLHSLEISIDKGNVTIQGNLPAHAKEKVVIYIPGWDMTHDDIPQLNNPQALLARTQQYWTDILSGSMAIDVPSKLLKDLIIASQVHCMLAARNEQDGQRISPWISSDRYGPLESEAQAVIHGMSLMGQEQFARRSLDFFINRYNKDGLLTTGYTLWGVGWHLWTLGDYYMIHRNSEWLKSVAPKLEQAGRWIVREREKTKQMDAAGRKLPEYGLMPPGVFADWSRFAYLVRPQGEFYAGLLGLAESYADIDYPGGDVFIEKAMEFREELSRAYHWSQARTPVIQLSNGTWIPYSPAIIGCFGPVGEMYPGEDGDRAWGKDVSSGPHHLVPLGLLTQKDTREINWISGYLEDNWFLKGGMGEYSAEEVQQNWFDLGAFYKVQPYYCRITELYAYNDDVKPFIRAYFNAIPTLISRENLTFWEHFHNTGGWNKTHETGWFLAQTRMMFVLEQNENELWLAPFVTNHWMQDGMTVGIRNSQTRFGTVGYRITSHVSEGFIQAQIDARAVKGCKRMILRLRHPDGKQIQSVTVNGKACSDYNKEKEYIILPLLQEQLTVRVEYQK